MPIMKLLNDYDCEKYSLKSKYTLIKYQVNLAALDQINDIKSYDEYLEQLKIDFNQLIMSFLDLNYEEITKEILLSIDEPVDNNMVKFILNNIEFDFS